MMGEFDLRTRIYDLGNKNMIGRKIAKLRELHKMSQNQLMSKMQVLGVDICYSSLSKLEGQTRQVSDKEVVVLAKIFGVTPNDLLK